MEAVGQPPAYNWYKKIEKSPQKLTHNMGKLLIFAYGLSLSLRLTHRKLKQVKWNKYKKIGTNHLKEKNTHSNKDNSLSELKVSFFLVKL